MQSPRKIKDVVILWTPNREGFPSGFRGKARIDAAPGHDIGAFPRRAGHVDDRAHHPMASVRQAYVLSVAREMRQDGIDPESVMSQVEEYANVTAALGGIA